MLKNSLSPFFQPWLIFPTYFFVSVSTEVSFTVPGSAMNATFPLNYILIDFITPLFSVKEYNYIDSS
jgi:hypothetical protein